MSWQNILNNRQIEPDIGEKLVNPGEVLREGISRSYLSLSSRNHASEPSTVGYVVSEQHWKSTLDFTEIVSYYGFKLGPVCQIVGFISQFSLELYILF